MGCFRCQKSSATSTFGGSQRGIKSLRRLSQAAAKYASAKLRDAGQVPVAPDWRARLEVCRGCHLQTIVDGERYCGRPLWERDPLTAQAEPGCGCPVRDKARDPVEHCPIKLPLNHRLTDRAPDCRCRWCETRRQEAK